MFDKQFLINLKNKLFKGFAVYLGSSVINKAIPFLLLPILTRYLSTKEYGILAIYQVMMTFGLPLVGMSMQNNITRNFFSKSKEYVASMVFNLLVVLILSSSLFLIAISIYLSVGGPQFSIPERWLYALPVIAFMNMVNSFNLTILRNRKKALEFGLFEILVTTIDLSVTILLIVVYSYGWEGRASGILAAALISGIISLYRIWKSEYLIFKFDKIKFREILKISMPLIPYGLGTAIITLSDRIFINQMVSTSAVGIYTVGYQFGMIMLLIVTAFNRVWSPWMYEELAEESEEKKRSIVKTTYLVGSSYILIAILLTIISYYLLPYMTALEYHSGIEYVIWIALGYAFNGIFALVFPYLVHVGKTSFLGIISMTGAVINLGLNYWLISLNQALGAAEATLITYIIMAFCLVIYSNKQYPMPWSLKKMKYD